MRLARPGQLRSRGQRGSFRPGSASGNGRKPSAANYYSWGQAGVGGPGESVTARLAYLDWLIPSTDVQVRMGRQVVNTPSYTFGSPILDDAIDGIMVNAPINDMVGVTFGWMRPFAEVNKWGVEHLSPYQR